MGGAAPARPAAAPLEASESCVAPGKALGWDRKESIPEHFASDGSNAYVIELLDGMPNRYQLVRVPLAGGPRTVLIPPTPGAWQPELVDPVTVARSYLAFESSSVGGPPLEGQLALVSFDLRTNVGRRVRLPAGVGSALQVTSIDADASGSFIAVAHEGESAVILRWDPTKDVPATLVARIPRSAPSGFLDSFAFDGTRHYLVRRGKPSRISAQPGASVAEVTAPEDVHVIGALPGLVYVAQYSAYVGKGEDAAPTKATLSVIDAKGMRVVSTEPFLPAATLIHDGFFYGVRFDGAETFVRFRRRLDAAGVGPEEVIAMMDESNGSFDTPVFDACSVMWRSPRGLERIALPRR